MRFRANNGTADNVDTTTGYTANTWHHACAVAASDASRSVYIDGGSKATTTTSISVSGEYRISIGRFSDSSPSVYFSGKIAEAAIWNIALSDAEVALLAKAVSPLMVRPEALIFYTPIIGKYSPEIDLIGGLSLTVTGATAAPHPRIIYPPRPQVPMVAAVVAGAAILARPPALRQPLINR